MSKLYKFKPLKWEFNHHRIAPYKADTCIGSCVIIGSLSGNQSYNWEIHGMNSWYSPESLPLEAAKKACENKVREIISENLEEVKLPNSDGEKREEDTALNDAYRSGYTDGVMSQSGFCYEQAYQCGYEAGRRSVEQ